MGRAIIKTKGRPSMVPDRGTLGPKYDYLIKKGRRTNTRRTYQFAIDGLRAFLKGKEITPASVLDYLLYLEREGAKWSTIKTYYYGLKKNIEGLEILKPYLDNLREGMAEDVTRVIPTGAKPLLIPDLIEGLQEAKERDRVLFALMYSGALRTSEAIQFRTSDFQKYPKGYRAKIVKGKNIRAGKVDIVTFPYSTKAKTATICPATLLDNYLPTKEGYIFPGYKDNHIQPRQVRDLVKRYFGKQYSPHSLRSGILTEAANKGASEAELMALSRHRDPQSLYQYIHSNPERVTALNYLF